MKLMQLNMWGGRLLKNVIELIEQEKPDILCLQEVVSSGRKVEFLFGSLEELQKKVDYPHVYYSPAIEFRLMNDTATWGNCILSRRPFMSEHTIFTNLEFVRDFNFEDYESNIRNLQHVCVSIDRQQLHILNHHGHHIHSHKNGDAATLRQCKLIADYIRTLDGAIILTGDFNLSPHSTSLEQINHLLTNLSIAHKLTTTRTLLTHKTEVCDYIFVNDQVRTRRFHASREVVSDHQALILEFDI